MTIDRNHNHTTAVVEPLPARRWEDSIGEALADHHTALSISILACPEYEQNGPSEL